MLNLVDYLNGAAGSIVGHAPDLPATGAWTQTSGGTFALDGAGGLLGPGSSTQLAHSTVAAATPQASFTNVRFVLKASGDSVGAAGYLFADGSDNGYVAIANANSVTIFKVVAGAYTAIGATVSGLGLALNVVHSIELQCSPGAQAVKINGVVKASRADATFNGSSGLCYGVYMTTSGGSYIDSIYGYFYEDLALGDVSYSGTATASITATATGGAASSISWRSGTTPNFDFDAAGTAVAGQTSLTLTAPQPAAGSRLYYRCRATINGVVVTSGPRLVKGCALGTLKLVAAADSREATGGSQNNGRPPTMLLAEAIRDAFGPRDVRVVYTAVPGTTSSDWAGATGNTALASAKAAYGNDLTGVIVFLPIGVNDAQALVPNATYSANLDTAIAKWTGAGATVILEPPYWREPGYNSLAGLVYDETANPLLLQYAATMAAKANGTTIVFSDAGTYDTFAQFPSLLFDRLHAGVNGAEGVMESRMRALQNLGVLTGAGVFPATANVLGTAPLYGPNKNLQGTASAGYALLPVNKVLFGWDRGDGQLGTVSLPPDTTVTEGQLFGPDSASSGKYRLPNRLWYLLDGPAYGVLSALQNGDASAPDPSLVLTTGVVRKGGVTYPGTATQNVTIGAGASTRLRIGL